MLKNYLTISLRNLTKNKTHSLINILGLTVGLVCCFYIFMWVQDELSYDRFHENADDLYRVILELPRGPQIGFTSYVAPAAAEWLKTNIPEVKETARFRIVNNRPQILVKYKDHQYFEEKFGFGDAALFDLFTFPFLLGDPKTALADPYSIVISESMAHKYFGSKNPIGEVLYVENQFDFVVMGVMKDIRRNSHLKFDSLVPFENIESFMPEYGEFLQRHNLHFFRTYVLAQKNASIPLLKDKVSNYMAIKFNKGETKDYRWKHHLQPVKEIHLHTGGMKDLTKRGDIRYIYVLSLTGILILLIACINFMNLTTARSSLRAREVGMRKVVGARRSALIGQFFGESILSALISLIFAIILVFVFLSGFNSLTGKEISLALSGNWLTYTGFLIITFITGILSGIYPALYLSSIKPVKVLKGTAGLERGKGLLRKTLVVAQFSIAVGLIICTLIIYNQYRYMRNRDLGFDKEHVVYTKLNDNRKSQYQVLKGELLKIPQVLNVTASSKNLTEGANHSGGFGWKGKENRDDDMAYNFAYVGYDFIETFRMPMVQGKTFSKDPSKNPGEEIIINESAAEMMNVESPIGLPAGEGRENGMIIGIVKDYHFQSLHRVIRPLVLTVDFESCQFMHIRIGPENIPAGIRTIEKIFGKFDPGTPFEYHFLDEAFEMLYRAEAQMNRLFNFFAVFAIFIASLGLFGLSMFIAESRYKEIGIRKVLGASVPNLIGLISKEFFALILLANIISWPLVYYAMKKWLQNFAYQAHLNMGIFILAGFLVLVISLFTVSFQSIKAATSNPIESLRYE